MAPRPGSLGMALDQNLTQKGVVKGMGLHAKSRTKLFREALRSDEMLANEGLIEYVGHAKKGESMAMSGGKVFIRASSQEYGDAATSVTFARTESITDGSIDGNDKKYTGEESTTDTRYCVAYANDSARPLADFGWGIDKLDTEWWGLTKDKRPLLTQWLGETKGYYLRHTILENISPNLIESPIGLSKSINPFLVFADDLVVPAYNPALATYKASIATASGNVTANDNHLTIRGLLDLGALAVDSYIKPLDLMGEAYYIMWTSEEEVVRLRDSSIQGSIAKDYINASIPKEVKDIVPMARLIVDKVILCVDSRCPTMAVSGAGAVTFGYMKQGRTSTRHTVTGGADGATYNANILLGAESVLMYERTMPNFKEQDDDYGREKGHLIHSCFGYSNAIWNIDTPAVDGSSARYEGGMIVLTSRQKATRG